MRHFLAGGALALAGACKGDASERGAPDTLAAASEVDSTEALAFMAAAHQSEVQAAQIGTRKASDTEVRQFAQLLWREHARLGRELSELARQMEIDLRAATPSSPMIANLRTTSQQTSQLLNGTARGAAFDRTYLESQVRMHLALLRDLQRIVGDTSRRVNASLAPGGSIDVGVTGRPDAPEAAAAASRTVNRKPENPQDAARMLLPQVQQHLERARQIQTRLRSGGAG